MKRIRAKINGVQRPYLEIVGVAVCEDLATVNVPINVKWRPSTDLHLIAVSLLEDRFHGQEATKDLVKKFIKEWIDQQDAEITKKFHLDPELSWVEKVAAYPLDMFGPKTDAWQIIATGPGHRVNTVITVEPFF